MNKSKKKKMEFQASKAKEKELKEKQVESSDEIYKRYGILSSTEKKAILARNIGSDLADLLM